MEKQIQLHNQSVNYTFKNSRRARRLRLTVYCDSTLVVTVPQGLNDTLVEKFIRQKAGWILNKLEFFKQFKDRVLVKNNEADYLKYKDKALYFAAGRVNYFNKIYKLDFNKINIKNQKTRWGSCSKKGNLNFNYKIIFLPGYIADYIIVHEICHLGQFNHSQKFWNLVAKAVPNYLEIKRDLKNKGLVFY